MEALAGWAGEQGHDVGEGASGLVGSMAEAFRDVDDHIATGAPECRYCPICRMAHVIRETSPEVKAHLATAAHSLLQAAAGMVATAIPDQESSAGFERIRVDDSDHEVDHPR